MPKNSSEIRNQKDNTYLNPSKTIEILRKYGIRLDKKYGQNFLVDENISRKIIKQSSVSKEDIILEVGGGIGILSRPLVKLSDFVHIIELDKKLLEPLKSNLEGYDNYEIHNYDALKFDYETLDPPPDKMVSNLPYNIATPLLIKILSSTSSIKNIFVTVQKELAERYMAKPNSHNYSAASVKFQLFSRIKKCFDIKPASFLPKPKVFSSFIAIDRIENDIVNKGFLMGIITDSFHYRRKTLYNSLMISKKYDERVLKEVLKISGISADQRAQELKKEDFIGLAENYLKTAHFKG